MLRVVLSWEPLEGPGLDVPGLLPEDDPIDPDPPIELSPDGEEPGVVTIRPVLTRLSVMIHRHEVMGVIACLRVSGVANGVPAVIIHDTRIIE